MSSSSSSSFPSIAGKRLVTVEECLAAYALESTADDGRVVFVDGSWHLGAARDHRAEFEAGPRVRGAVLFDIDDVAVTGDALNPKNLPHMRPPKNLFAAAMDALHIRNDDHVVVYGTTGCMFAHRAAHTFKSFGHDDSRVHLMQGSLGEWETKGGAVDTGIASAIQASELDTTAAARYVAQDPTDFYDYEDVLKIVTDTDQADAYVVDARSAGRFRAEAPEPRPGVLGGHMPGALNVPFGDLLLPDDEFKVKPVDELKAIFEAAGVDITTEKKLVLSCGSGVSACVLATALEECGRDRGTTYVYDGSWLDWGTTPDAPIVS